MDDEDYVEYEAWLKPHRNIPPGYGPSTLQIRPQELISKHHINIIEPTSDTTSDNDSGDSDSYATSSGISKLSVPVDINVENDDTDTGAENAKNN